MAKHLILYNPCHVVPRSGRARRFCCEWRVPYQEVNCSTDAEALERNTSMETVTWALPAVVIAEEGSLLPGFRPKPASPPIRALDARL